MEILPLLCILSVVCTGLTTGAGVLPDVPLNAAVGQTVTFTPTLTPPLVTVIWNFNQNKNIITFTGETFTAPEYEGRITFSPSSGSLELWSVNLNDTGEYSVFIIRQGELAKNGATTLRVYEPVSNVTLAANSTDLVEFNSSVTLTCSSSGPSLSFLWLNSSSEVTESDRVQLTDGGSTLTIVNVTRYDQGPFRCLVSNPVSNGSSIAVNLSISYGPENIILTSPPHEYYAVGSNFILSCSADSRPAAMFYWFLNGDQLTDTGAELRLTNIQMSQSGNYSCQGFNQKTGRYETSQSSPVTVLEPVSNVMLAASSTDLVEFNSSVTLTCSSSGSSLSFLWLNSSSEVTESDRVQLTDGGSTLTIVSVTRYDQGPFRCLVSNPVSNDSSNEVNLSISYGPDNVQITGPSEVHVGQAINLTCSAESNPSASYTWMLNGTEIHNSAVFTKNTPEPSDSGEYTCQVTNKITERTSSAVHVLSVTGNSATTSGCSGGCIAGIVIAVLVILGAAGGGGYYVYRKKKQQKKPSNRNTATGPTRIEGHDNQTYSEELNYADIKFFKNKDGGTVQLGQQNNSEYAQIKVNNRPVVEHSPPTYDAHLQRPKREAPQPDVTQLYAKVNKNRANHT
uniref:carcinoembryonic antigen-related cell adhesion molecule 5-like isoform X3 n=1 Tax=Scatophagus argus TaxID=75038 RepID=UPI001ED7EA06|nr:carcinoembryonic antigen-related cell adhesion molecule 5-like isoform X3 [Scatophagus argus]